MTARPSGTLVQAAAELLRRGPVHTLELARDVMGLSGHPGAASAAVFSLLGTDSRFSVDGEGTWSLREGATAVGAPLRSLTYAVVDVETTGGSPGRGHRITEVAIVEISNGVISDEFQTLVNPGRGISPRVSELTGITSEMVDSAPFFDHLAEEIRDRLSGRVFVAHNATFDWGFLSEEMMNALGEVPNVTRLCTLRMARRFAPELRRRNLDSLTTHFGIEIHDRHRAYGDALATARVFLRLLDEADLRGVSDLVALEGVLGRSSRARRIGLEPATPREEPLEER